MKNILTVIALLAISILYMFEVEYSQVTTLNWIAFAIIFITIVYVTASLALSRERHKQARIKRKQAKAVAQPTAAATDAPRSPLPQDE